MKVSVSRVRNNGKAVWRVRFKPPGGKAVRRFFQSKAMAEAERDSILEQQRTSGEAWLAMSAAERNELMAVAAEVKARGLSLRAVWQEWQGRMEAKVRKALGEVIVALLAAKSAANRRPDYMRKLGFMLRQFARGREARFVDEFTVDDLQQWVNGFKSPGTRATWRARLGTLFDFAWRNGWRADNPAARLERVTTERGVPAVFTPAKCERIMRTALATDRGLVRLLALVLFGACRPMEAERIVRDNGKAVDVSNRRITVDAAASKVRHRRIIHDPAHGRDRRRAMDTFFRWWKLGQPDDLKNLRRRMALLRMRVELSGEALRRAEADYQTKNRTAVRWPHDVLRHTCASQLCAICGAKDAAAMLGHSEDMLRTTYRDIITPEEAEWFWGIEPQKAVAIAWARARSKCD